MKISCSIALLLAFVLQGAPADELRSFTITKINEKSATVELEEKNGLDLSLTSFEIYNVYERIIDAAGQKLLVNFCGSVYLEKVSAGSLEFAFTWEEEGRYLKKGYIAAATGRLLSGEREELVKIIDTGKAQDVEKKAPSPAPVFQIFAFGGPFLNTALISTEPLFAFGVRGELIAMLIDRLGASIKVNSGDDFSYVDLDIGLNYYWSIRPNSIFTLYIYAGLSLGVLSTNSQTVSTDGIRYFAGEAGFIFNLPFKDSIFAQNLFIGLYIYYHFNISTTVNVAPVELEGGIKIGYHLL